MAGEIRESIYLQSKSGRGVRHMKRNTRGQSILEYVIVLTVIIAAVALAATQYIKPAVTKNFEDVQGTMQGATSRLPK